MALQALKKRESFSDKAYQMLREAILTGELKPGNSMYTVYRIHFESSSIKYAKIEMHRNITL